MIKDNRASLWLGAFEDADDFYRYVEVSYDEDGNVMPSIFQQKFKINKYDYDAIEVDWISIKCENIESLLYGFSGDSQIIPQYSEMIEREKIKSYNSIVLVYNFEYDESILMSDGLSYIGCVDVTL